ncbi:MAG: hypothetical protein ACK41E_08770 [Deinococcales bacterium]
MNRLKTARQMLVQQSSLEQQHPCPHDLLEQKLLEIAQVHGYKTHEPLPHKDAAHRIFVAKSPDSQVQELL